LNRILLLLEHRENSRLLSEWLSNRYEVIEPNGELETTTAALYLSQPFDLCIIGARALNRLWQAVQARRSREQPVLLPFLLVTARPDVNYVTRELWQSIDELITQPIEKLELQARVEILLRSRQLSLQLKAANQQREQQTAARQQAEVFRDLAIEAQQIDHTGRKHAEAALQENEQQLSLALQTGRLGSWQLDLQTGSLSTSTQCRLNFGLSSDADCSHQKLGELIHPDDRAWVQSALDQAVVTNTDYDVEYRTIWADGSTHWVLVRGRCFYDRDDTPLRMVGMSMDITDRKQAEAEREHLLAQTQAARTQAEAANRTKDEFLAVLSHELRSPLNPILGWAKLLQTHEFEPAMQRKAIETIERNAKLQSQLIEDLLDISRILNGKLALETGLVDLESTLRAALETVQLAAEAKGIQIQTCFEPLQIWGDANRLQQVSWNLFSNAIKFTPRGGSVVIKLEQQDAQAQIIVSDTGKGISSSFLPYVFESFRQADGSTTRKFGGLGLGLAIVRQVVELHGGTVRAESLGEGQGATFIVQLPCLAIGLSNTSPRYSDASTAAHLPLTAIQVLLVDDDEDSRSFAAFVLEQSGAIVTAAASAREALTAINTSSPDILVSDIGMPSLDGYELIQRIRSLPCPSQAIPAIALTAYAGEANCQQALQSGFQLHLVKPIEPDKLVQAIGELLNPI
jgi:PAS domain S-box-containing protein